MTEAAPAGTGRAVEVLHAVLAAGVREIVVCPGSRSQALAFAAVEAERAGAARVHVRTDERVAGFFALGLARESGLPAAVIVTSGTAVANLHPAVLEADAERVPLVLLTADRPSELHEIRANQTFGDAQSGQLGVFGRALRFGESLAPAELGDVPGAAGERAQAAVRAARGAGEAGPGPVQLNLAFRDPLARNLSDDERARFAALAGAAVPEQPRPAVVDRPTEIVRRGPRTIVVAGNDAGPAAEELAHRGGWPLLAEVGSGARFGRNLIVPARELAAHPELGGRVERALVLGHPTLSREIPALLGRDDVETIIIDPQGAHPYRPRAGSGRIVAAVEVEDGASDRAWLGDWIRAARDGMAAQESAAPAPALDEVRARDPRERSRFAREALALLRRPVDRAALVDAVWRASWPHDRLVLGASRLIREADRRVPGKKIPVHANRGLAGIDGTVATALGVAAAARSAGGTTRVLLGDLTLLHDAGALLLTPGEERPRIQVIVGNDGGGSIFDGLEAGQIGDAEMRDRVLFTPRHVEFAALAEAYGWLYRRAATHGELDEALTTPSAGPVLIEVPLAR